MVFNFESGKPVTVDNAQQFTTFHPRCGTSFMFVIMLMSMLVYILIPVQGFAAKLALRIVMLPVITGLSYELIRFAAKRRGSFMALLTAPGLVDTADHHPAAFRRAGRSGDSGARRRDGARNPAGRRTRHRLIRKA